MSDKHEKPCPKCGHCPTCGRSNQWNPVYPWQYWQNPYWWHNQPKVTYNTLPNNCNSIGGGGVQWGTFTNNAAAN